MTSRDVEAGETLLSELPLMRWVDLGFHERVCAWCMRCGIEGSRGSDGGDTQPLKLRLQCSGCAGRVRWCSERCAAEHAAEHTIACPIIAATSAGTNSNNSLISLKNRPPRNSDDIIVITPRVTKVRGLGEDFPDFVGIEAMDDVSGPGDGASEDEIEERDVDALIGLASNLAAIRVGPGSTAAATTVLAQVYVSK